MAFVYYEETRVYRPAKKEPESDPSGAFATLFGVVFWFIVIAGIVKGCSG